MNGMSDKNIYDVQEIRRRLEPVFAQNGVKSAVLFGSYAMGTANPESDVDILVDSGLRGLDFCGLVEYIHVALGKKVDVIDSYYVKPDSRITHEISATGVQIYER